ncbi:sugar ABC transporter ATP-binding protein [Roseovarius sp. Pro17]|uniref:sugar ABC transporter ATP-binding protein n=1 Tax=Roseovarius sp. Pro17 TaxID=3108175 RepID=UPI002D796C89|nr:sugar ABC transporter ATP-binding protein [Roseovarius sp. Pro17]
MTGTTKGPGASLAPGTSAEPLIEIAHLDKSYGAFKALEDMQFELRAGEVHVLFGENGAGKSTLIQIICGVQGYDKGEYRLFGETLTGLTPAVAHEKGVSIVFQEFSLIPDMTVEENLFLGHEITSGGRLAKSQMRKKVQAVLDRLGFQLDPAARVSTLRRANQQMVEIAKALLWDCRVLILDEPTASLTDQEAAQLFDIIEQLRSEGLGIIYVSHRMPEITRLADRVTVLRDGKFIATVNNADTSEKELVQLMTGRTFDEFFPQIHRDPGETVLSFDDVTLQSGLAENLSFSVRRGEVLGFAGLAGCGKSEVLRAAFGLEAVRSGTITANGATLDKHNPRKALRNRICYFPSDRSTEGLAMHQSLISNSTIAALDDPVFSRKKTLLNRRAERGFTETMIDKLKIRTPGLNAKADQLSGGNKQKLMIARGLSREFDVFLFDEPTVGVDIQAKLEIYDVIKTLTEDGKAVVIASSELAEVMHMSHRVIVMREGRIVGELDGDDITEDAVLSHFFDHVDVDHEQGQRAT